MKKNCLLAICFLVTLAISSCTQVSQNIHQESKENLSPADNGSGHVLNTATATFTPSRSAHLESDQSKMENLPKSEFAKTPQPTPFPPFFQTPTFDVASVITVTAAYQTTCPKNNPAFRPEVIAPPEEALSDFFINRGEYISGSNLSREMGDFDKQLLDALNQGATLTILHQALVKNIANDANFQLKVQDLFQQDITGDGVPEVVFFNPHYFFAVYLCQEGKYKNILSLPRDSYLYVSGVTIYDLDLDGLPEMIADEINTANMKACYEYSIYHWSGKEIIRLSMSGFPGDDFFPESGILSVCASEPSKLLDINSDGFKEVVIQVNMGKFGNPFSGPYRDSMEVIAWNGSQFIRLPPTYTPPVYLHQAVHDGDRAFIRGDFEEALKFYQMALNDKHLKGWSKAQYFQQTDMKNASWSGGKTPMPTVLPDDPNEYPNLAAYSRFKIILGLLAQGKVDMAGKEYDRLKSDYLPGQPGAQFVEMARIFWEEYEAGGKFDRACKKVHTYITHHEEETSGLVSAEWQEWPSPGLSEGELTVAQYMCPF